MVIKDGTLTSSGATVIISDTLDFTADYSQEFYIEKFKDNKWRKLHTSSKTTWLLRLYTLDENNELELEQNWEAMYGKLDRGTYRLIKYISVPNENGLHKDMFKGRYSLYKFYTEFEIK